MVRTKGVLALCFSTFILMLAGLSLFHVSAFAKGEVKVTAQSCKADCQDSYAYCISHPKECGHNGRACTNSQLTVACTNKYGKNCSTDCDARYGSKAAPENKCVLNCQESFDKCTEEGYRVGACDKKYGESCKTACQ